MVVPLLSASRSWPLCTQEASTSAGLDAQAADVKTRAAENRALQLSKRLADAEKELLRAHEKNRTLLTANAALQQDLEEVRDGQQKAKHTEVSPQEPSTPLAEDSCHEPSPPHAHLQQQTASGGVATAPASSTTIAACAELSCGGAPNANDDIGGHQSMSHCVPRPSAAPSVDSTSRDNGTDSDALATDTPSADDHGSGVMVLGATLSTCAADMSLVASVAAMPLAPLAPPPPAVLSAPARSAPAPSAPVVPEARDASTVAPVSGRCAICLEALYGLHLTCSKCNAGFHAECTKRTAKDGTKPFTCTSCTPLLKRTSDASLSGGGSKKAKNKNKGAAEYHKHMLCVLATSLLPHPSPSATYRPHRRHWCVLRMSAGRRWSRRMRAQLKDPEGLKSGLEALQSAAALVIPVQMGLSHLRGARNSAWRVQRSHFSERPALCLCFRFDSARQSVRALWS